MQILWAFRCNPMAPHGLSYAVKPGPQNRFAILRPASYAQFAKQIAWFATKHAA
jgi:hypothetical protein